MWRIFSKKNRTYTIGGVLAFVVLVFLIYKYVLKGTIFGDTLQQTMRDPTSIAGGYGKGWEQQTYRPMVSNPQKIVIASGGTGRSSAEAISLTS